MPERYERFHVCARCGKKMQYSEKSMLYIFKVQPIRFAKIYPFARPQPKAIMSLNLCEECRIEAEQAIRNWVGQGKEANHA